MGSGSRQSELSDEQVDVLAYIEQTWWNHSTIPTNERIADAFGWPVELIRSFWKDSKFKAALVRRGIDFRPERSRAILTPQQLQLANSLLNMHDKRSVREKLREVGVTSTTYHNWLKNQAFQQYLRTRAEELFRGADAQAYMALVSAAEGGDVPALKLFFEMRGIYNPRVQLDVNVDVVLARVVEIVQKHVRDETVLLAIAADLEKLSSGEVGTPTPARIASHQVLDVPGRPVDDVSFDLDSVEDEKPIVPISDLRL